MALALIQTAAILLDVAWWILIVQFILSWLITFNVINTSTEIIRSSWIALRQFPQLHTNPVGVIVDGKPIRASRESAQWALGCIDQLWRIRGPRIAETERADAKKAYEEARAIYRKIAEESPTIR